MATVSMARPVTSDPSVTLLLVLLVLLLPFNWSLDAMRPGCHLYPFNVTIRSDRRGTCQGGRTVYACVGYCDSSAFPSRYSILLATNFSHIITSTSRCCTIRQMAKVKVRMECAQNYHDDRYDIEILTAKACRCDTCHRSHY
ncbi:glycoprotein hormone alpha-2 [Brachyhypopomus gauderio]|uniref:glycoprotein hormone alpha-2 n=1 Tax=Brachyhypopomus gauderio TaxID=698409 RepID=UPI004042B945